jgi:hypothetical protein
LDLIAGKPPALALLDETAQRTGDVIWYIAQVIAVARAGV